MAAAYCKRPTQKNRKFSPKIQRSQVIQRDVKVTDWIWSNIWQILRESVEQSATALDDVRAQIFLGTSSAFAEYLFWLPMFWYYSLKTLFKEDIDRVLDTQVMGTSATIKALRLFNRVKKKSVVLEKVLVDFTHEKRPIFSNPIRKLNAKDRRLLRLITIAPMLEKEQTAEQFWQQHCKLNDTHLQYEDYFVR